MPNYDGLTRNTWPGTWSPSSTHPIVLDTEVRGSLRFVSGTGSDTVTNIPGQRLQEGMLVYVANSHSVYLGGAYYKYKLLSGESRNAATGAMPNATGNWEAVNVLQQASVDLDSAGANQIVDIFPKTQFRTCKYIVQLEHDSDNKYHSTEILLTHNNTTVSLTEYAIVKTDSDLGVFDATIDGSNNVQLLVNPSFTNTSVKAKRISIDA